MSICPIVEYPHPSLRASCEPISAMDSTSMKVITDLKETMASYPGCVGLAANQIDIKLSIAVVDVSSKIPNSELKVLINPRIVGSRDNKVIREGCLSVQQLTANVVRANEVDVEWLDLNGQIVTYTAKGFEAICIQHEIDHLNGRLFLDHVLSAKTDIFRRKRYLH